MSFRIANSARPIVEPPSSIEPPDYWLTALSHELAYWKRIIGGDDQRWAGVIRERSILRDLDPVIFKLAVEADPDAEARSASPIKILDVGAGPLTVLGNQHPDRALEITAIDPLASSYDRILRNVGINPPVRTIQGEAERLVEQFGLGVFDLVFSQNALDHSYDPILGIRQMLQVAKPRGLVRLEHAVNEAEHQHYSGLHQWNFCADSAAGSCRFIIWNKAERRDLTAELGDHFIVRCDMSQDCWISVTIRKK